MRKFLVGLLTMALLVGLIPSVVHAEDLVTNSEAGVLMEVTTGRILYERNPDEPLKPASMTKMMSLYLVLEAIEAGRLEWEQTITISEHAASMGGTQIYLEVGEQMTVRDLFMSVALPSANDSVTALAEAVSGNEADFVALMNERAAEFGMTNTVFINPTGLPAEGHLTTARDMAVLGSHLVMDFPEITAFTSMYEAYVREDSDEPFWLVNTNKLIRYVDGVDGLKTGYTSESGHSLTATAERDGMRVVAVVMAADSSSHRNREVSRLIEYAFAQYELHPMMAAGDVVGTHEHALAEGRRFNVVMMDPVSLVVAVGTDVGETHVEVVLDAEFTVPIAVGDVVGVLIYYLDGEVYQEVALTVEEPVERAGFVSLWTSVLGRLFFGEY
ncbi:MAG: D-alanyl-D-alanine carboxypeptidase [Turicibacter sp.]|nr:D-alanyl-D-alanine carboxypeptidase [Turicibacter sp.]